jgi:selenocysteine lyase/cysteine desulfurase
MQAELIRSRRQVSVPDLDWAMLRRTEYGRLDTNGHAYLDYTGAALHSRSQAEAHHQRLLDDVLGNPHSQSTASADATARMEQARERVLAFLNADPAVYDVIFCANASAALRLVGESFPFTSASRYVLTADNHNSVNGIRCYAQRAGARVQYVPLNRDLSIPDPSPWLEGAPAAGRHLFAFPAQSNFSGARHPLAWIRSARAHGYRVLLDTSALLPTTTIDLMDAAPDYACISFYKLFGLPTGLGALIARKDALDELRRPWFAGGTVFWVSIQRSEFALRTGPSAFEEGTPNFLAFDAVLDGFDFLDRIGMRNIAARVCSLTASLIGGLKALRHPAGEPLVELYGPGPLEDRGPTVAFNVLDVNGRVLHFEPVVAAAAEQRVSLRGGCFCNPGCAEAALSFPEQGASACRKTLGRNFNFADMTACMGSPVGAVRASVGIPTVPADIYRLFAVLERYRGVRQS